MIVPARVNTLIFAVTAGLALAGPSLAGERRSVQLTDPYQLTQLGYPADARNVYLLEPAAGPAPVRDAEPTGAPGNIYTASAGFEFFPLTDAVEYVKGPAFLVYNGALASLTAGGFYETQLQPPPGVTTLRWMDLAGWHDHSTQTLLVSTIERCLPFLAGGNPTETVLLSSSVTDRNGEFVLSQNTNRPVLNSTCTYHVRVRMGDTGGAAASVLIQVSKARAEWGT